MAIASAYTTEVTRLRVREFNKVIVGGGIRLLKCETCGRLTDHGVIIERDIVEEGASGQLEKTGYERWMLCLECAQPIMHKVNGFTEDIIGEINTLKRQNEKGY